MTRASRRPASSEPSSARARTWCRKRGSSKLASSARLARGSEHDERARELHLAHRDPRVTKCGQCRFRAPRTRPPGGRCRSTRRDGSRAPPCSSPGGAPPAAAARRKARPRRQCVRAGSPAPVRGTPGSRAPSDRAGARAPRRCGKASASARSSRSGAASARCPSGKVEIVPSSMSAGKSSAEQLRRARASSARVRAFRDRDGRPRVLRQLPGSFRRGSR